MQRYLTWLLLILPLIGCNTTKDSSTIPKTDPLLGSGPIKPTSYTPPPTSQPNAQPINQPVTLQPPSAPSNSMSTAELAAGIHQPLDANHDLRIGNPNNTSGPAQGDAWHATGGAGGPSVALNRPEPIPDGNVPATSAPGPTAVLTSGSTAPTQGEDPLVHELKARGMVWIDMQLNADTNEWNLACAFPNRQNPDVQRTYEVRARDQASGLRAIIDRVDKDR
jgi:hypothetical protein